MNCGDETRKKLNLQELIQKMDLLGIVLFSVGVVGLLLFLLSLKATVNYVAGIVGVISLLLFAWHELKTKIPFINIRLFRSNRKLSLVFLQYIVLNFIYYSLFFGLPSYFQDGLHLSVGYSGLLMLFVTGMGIITAPLIGRWIDKSGVNIPILMGNMLIVIGALLLWIFFDHVPVIVMALIVSLIAVLEMLHCKLPCLKQGRPTLLECQQDCIKRVGILALFFLPSHLV